ncbi:hypothetical protein ACQKWADRAFT_136550 [Trichoderma austrokoningii]
MAVHHSSDHLPLIWMDLCCSEFVQPDSFRHSVILLHWETRDRQLSYVHKARGGRLYRTWDVALLVLGWRRSRTMGRLRLPQRLLNCDHRGASR